MSVFFLILFFVQLDASKEYEYIPPTQPPIRPPYEQACHFRKHNLLSREDPPPVSSTQSREEQEP